MSKITATVVKKLRDETGAGVMAAKAALEEAQGGFEKAKEILRKKGEEVVSKKAARQTAEGLIETYVHVGGKIAGVVELNCETDFVARTDEFRHLARELAMQIAAMNPQTVDELLTQEYIRDPNRKIGDLIKEVIVRTGENIKVGKIARFSL